MGVPLPAPGASLLETPDRWGDAQRRFWRDWSPRILAIWVGGFAIWRVTLGPPSAGDLLGPVALVLFWPFHEWLIHRFLLHFEPRRVGPFTVDLHVASSIVRTTPTPGTQRSRSFPSGPSSTSRSRS